MNAPERDNALSTFLDHALECLARGEPVAVGDLLRGHPELAEEARRLVDDVGLLLSAARGLQEQSSLMRLDAVELAPASPPGAEEADPFPGEYRLERVLGKGAFGVVWLAEDVRLGRPVALKTVTLPPGQAPELKRRLEAEARLLGGLRHRHLVALHAWREAAGRPYLVMEYVAGGSLADRVRAEGPLAWQQAVRYVAEVGEALALVHARGIVHRDVKPANLLWSPEGDEAKLSDFGIAARLGEPGTVAGTPFYLPPEAFEGVVTPAQDVYGLAASLFWLTTGSVPFPGLELAVLRQKIERGLPSPDPRCQGMPVAIEGWIRRGLASRAEERPPLKEFVEGVRAELNRLLADGLLLQRGGMRAGLRLTISRRVGDRVYEPIAASRPMKDRPVRDVRRVPEEPEWVEVHSGERLRIEVEVDRPGFVTVFNVGPSGNLNLLYPRRGFQAWVEDAGAVRTVEVELSPPVGQERLLALWTREELPLRESDLLALAEGDEWAGPGRATRDIRRVQEAVEELGAEAWQAVILGLSHRPSR